MDGKKRATYHHGDLRAALIEAGIARAREGGPDAVVLREVARAVGVAPNSAYGHFATLTALKKAVAREARIGMAEAMGAYLDEAGTADLREVGRAYVRYALAEPGLFRTAMGGDPTGIKVPAAPDDPDDDRPRPRLYLNRALEGLVAAGSLRPEDVSRAAIASWATVHGLSIMLLDLLPQLTPAERAVAVDDALDVLLAGLTRSPR